MPLTCCIIDDEPLAVKLLESYVLKTPSLQLTGTYSNAVAALDDIMQRDVDLIFCDIQMPDLNGLQFAEIMKTRNSRIVFTTAFSEYAVEGWKANALHYLLKPINYNEFMTAVTKAQQWFDMAGSQQTLSATNKMEDDLEDDNINQPSISGDSMFVKSDYKLVRIHFNQILYVEGLKDYVKIYIEGERRPILSLTSMRAVEAALPKEKFQRTHRSFIVNLEKVEVLERGQIVFGDKHIPVSDSYKDVVQNYFSAITLQGRNS